METPTEATPREERLEREGGRPHNAKLVEWALQGLFGSDACQATNTSDNNESVGSFAGLGSFWVEPQFNPVACFCVGEETLGMSVLAMSRSHGGTRLLKLGAGGTFFPFCACFMI